MYAQFTNNILIITIYSLDHLVASDIGPETKTGLVIWVQGTFYVISAHAIMTIIIKKRRIGEFKFDAAKLELQIGSFPVWSVQTKPLP